MKPLSTETMTYLRATRRVQPTQDSIIRNREVYANTSEGPERDKLERELVSAIVDFNEASTSITYESIPPFKLSTVCKYFKRPGVKLDPNHGGKVPSLAAEATKKQDIINKYVRGKKVILGIKRK